MSKVVKTLTVDRNASDVWKFVSEMGNWAEQMPGYIRHSQMSDTLSEWELQVNLGPFQRPVLIEVQVDEWLEPHEVSFSLKGKNEPFEGSGSFHSESEGERTAVTLEFSSVTHGSMAKVLAAMAAPVLEQLATQFAANLKNALEGARKQPVGSFVASPAPESGLWRRLLQRLRLLRA